MDGQVEQEERKEGEEVQAALQTEWRSAETRQSPGDEDDQEEEELSFTHEEKEDLHLRREEEEEKEHKMSDKVGFLLLLPLSQGSVCFPHLRGNLNMTFVRCPSS